MRIVFDSTVHPSRVARSLRGAFAKLDRKLGLIDGKELAARMFGYASWSELAAACAAPPSPFDHMVSPDEASARRAAYLRVLTEAGLTPDQAGSVIDEVRPTAVDAAAPVDLMDGAQADRLGVRGFDAAAFNLTPGGSRLLRAMRAAAADDPYWGRRGGIRARTPDDPWLVRTLTEMRATPVHAAWAPLAVLCLAELSALLDRAHPFLGPYLPAIGSGLAANSPDALSAPLDAMPLDAMMSLSAHVEDLLPVLLSRHAPGPATDGAVAPPEVRRPWRHRRPFDLRRPDPAVATWSPAGLAGFDLFAPGMTGSVPVRVACAPGSAAAALRSLSPAASAAGHDLRPDALAEGPRGRDDVLLALGPDGEPWLAVAIRSRADTAAQAHHVDVAGPFPVGPAVPPAFRAHLESALLATAVERFEDDLQSWGRTIPPGGRLSIFVSPARQSADAFLGRFVHVAGDRFAEAESEMPDLGFDLVLRNATRDGAPAPLPALHIAAVPREARDSWTAFAAAAADTVIPAAGTVVARLAPGHTIEFADAAGRPISGRSPELDAASERLGDRRGVDIVRRLLAEAGLGPDAAVYLTGDFAAVLSRENLEDRDWSIRRGICLVVPTPPSEGERERLLNRFWAAFPSELDAILDARRAGLPSGGNLVPGPTSRQ